MAINNARTIHLDPDSELARALASVNGEPIFLDSNGVRFRIIPVEEDIWMDYDPEKVRAGLRRFAGMISPEEADRIKEQIYRGREEGTRPPDQP